MLDFLFTVIADGDTVLSTAGYTAVAVIIFALLIISAMLTGKKKSFNAKVIAFSAIAIALAVVTSNIRLVRMPQGGSATLFSMLFITLTGYWFGPVAGLTCGVSYGFLQLIMGGYILSLPQLLIDYPFSFGALGISGFFAKRENGLVEGYLAGVVGRFIFAVISGVVFFGMYAPEDMSPLVYSIGYNSAYLSVEAVITVVLLLIPAVKRAMAQVKSMAA